MNRRSFFGALATIIGGALAPKADLFDPERALWIPGEKTIFDVGASTQKAIAEKLTGDLTRWRIQFPDGTAMTFEGILSHIEANGGADGFVNLDVSVRPTGAPTFEQLPKGEYSMQPMERGALYAPGGTILSRGSEQFEITEIEPPRIERQRMDVTTFMDSEPRFEEMGLKRMTDLRFSLNFDPTTGPDVLDKLRKEMWGG